MIDITYGKSVSKIDIKCSLFLSCAEKQKRIALGTVGLPPLFQNYLPFRVAVSEHHTENLNMLKKRLIMAFFKPDENAF